MVELGISEFTFGYAFLYERTRKYWDSLVAAPILPSLQQEAEKGWDARLPKRGCDFYYQFKLSDRLERTNARFIADGTYGGSYYRIKLYARNFNRQHRMLWRHAKSNQHTYYVAPEFETIDDFNQAFLSNTITEHSRLIPLRQCDNYSSYDSEQHYITYRENDSEFHQHSKASRHEKSRSGKELEKIYDESRQSWRPINEDFADEILEQTKEKLFTLTNEERYVFSFVDFYEKEADNKKDEIIAKGFLDNVNGFIDQCKGDGRAIKKLARILKNGGLERLSKEKINIVVRDYSLALEFDAGGKIIVSKENTWTVLRILDDDYVRSDVTETKYEARSKIKK